MFRDYIEKIRKDNEAFRRFKEALKKDFQDDFELAKEMMNK